MSTAATVAEEESASPKSSKKKLILIAAIVAVIAAAGGAGAFYYLKKPGDGAHQAEEAPKPRKPPVYIPFDPIVVNLADTDGDRMMQVTFAFEAADPKSADLVKASTPAIRNRVILLLTSKSSKDIAGREGKEKLAEEILAESRAAMGSTKEMPVIDGVHFSGFVVQ